MPDADVQARSAWTGITARQPRDPTDLGGPLVSRPHGLGTGFCPAAALAGLAPHPDDSGKRTGQGCVTGGRMLPSGTLFVAATSGFYRNPDMKGFCDRLIGRGNAQKVALTAVMRKLVILANVLLREDGSGAVIAPEPSPS
ncbi:MAG: hypothetical protein F4213_02620 [Boseongicola sp. SB0677_bin_26]|nr:hypothetical protein [Boseongicola sp. SB0677_bin_26]